jgi:hypothetical protein
MRAGTREVVRSPMVHRKIGSTEGRGRQRAEWSFTARHIQAQSDVLSLRRCTPAGTSWCMAKTRSNAGPDASLCHCHCQLVAQS